MKRKIVVILFISLLIIASSIVISFVWQNKFKEDGLGNGVEELGIPLLDRYPNSPLSRTVWDMIMIDNKLYVGSGNYNSNAGPIDVWYYDLLHKKWQKDGTLPDEELNRFLLLDGQLTIPGIDPKDDWNWGNYYISDKQGWKTIRTIPGGIHNFDMVSFKGEWFAGLDVKAGETPIVRSRDNGETFETVPMKKDGVMIDTSKGDVMRTYDFFVLKNTLYATFWYESKKEKNICLIYTDMTKTENFLLNQLGLGL